MHLTWVIARGSGIATWGLATCVVAWGLLLRTRLLGRVYEGQRILAMHKFLTGLTLTFLLVHIVSLILDPYVNFTVPMVLVPGLASWQPLAVALGIIAMWLMAPVSLIGRVAAHWPRISHLFRQSHYLAYAMWPFATAHYIMAGTDAMTLWSLAILVFGTGALVFLLLSRGFVPLPPLDQRHTKPSATPPAAADQSSLADL